MDLGNRLDVDRILDFNEGADVGNGTADQNGVGRGNGSIESPSLSRNGVGKNGGCFNGGKVVEPDEIVYRLVGIRELVGAHVDRSTADGGLEHRRFTGADVEDLINAGAVFLKAEALDEEGGFDEIHAFVPGHLFVGILDDDDVAREVGIPDHMAFGDAFVFLDDILNRRTCKGEGEVVRIIRWIDGLGGGTAGNAGGGSRANRLGRGGSGREGDRSGTPCTRWRRRGRGGGRNRSGRRGLRRSGTRRGGRRQGGDAFLRDVILREETGPEARGKVGRQLDLLLRHGTG